MHSGQRIWKRWDERRGREGENPAIEGTVQERALSTRIRYLDLRTDSLSSSGVRLDEER